MWRAILLLLAIAVTVSACETAKPLTLEQQWQIDRLYWIGQTYEEFYSDGVINKPEFHEDRKTVTDEFGWANEAAGDGNCRFKVTIVRGYVTFVEHIPDTKCPLKPTGQSMTSEEKWFAYRAKTIGTTETEFVLSQGSAPDRVYTTSDGTRILTYNLFSETRTSGFSEFDWEYGDGFTQRNTYRAECNVVAMIRDEMVWDLGFDGNECPSY